MRSCVPDAMFRDLGTLCSLGMASLADRSQLSKRVLDGPDLTKVKIPKTHFGTPQI